MRIHSLRLTHLGAALLGTVIASGGAQAEPRRNPSGATFGVGIGVGHINCEDADGNDCDGDGVSSAVGLAARAGVMLGRDATLSAEVWGMRHEDDAYDVTQVMVTGVVRGWLAPRLWLQGGIGVARTTAHYDLGNIGQVEQQTDVVPALVAGVGLELVSDRTFAVDLELKGGTGLYRDDLRVYNASIGVGLSFY